MTYLEKARELRPDLTDREIRRFCPVDLELETTINCPRNNNVVQLRCEDCWSREMPNKNNEEETKL